MRISVLWHTGYKWDWIDILGSQKRSPLHYLLYGPDQKCLQPRVINVEFYQGKRKEFNAVFCSIGLLWVITVNLDKYILAKGFYYELK